MWSFLKPGVKPDAVSATAPYIPRVIWQTTKDRQTIAPELAGCVAKLKAMHPGWEHKLHDDTSQLELLQSLCSERFLQAYARIEPRYGAARSDLFRYVMLFLHGGVYLDLKSGTTRPLEQILRPEDRYIISQWDNAPGGQFETIRFHKRLRDVPGGEYEQWFIIAEPGHAFLAKTLENALQNIKTYNPFRFQEGSNGVINVTGPVVYTQSIRSIETQHPSRRICAWPEGLRYTVLASLVAHQTIDTGHYGRVELPPVTAKGLQGWPRLRYALLKLLYAPVSKIRRLNNARLKRRYLRREQNRQI
ncbi:MAG: glycosyltransferase family 32 protein [Cypionkella sp.]